jgi:hypothetical protein
MNKKQFKADVHHTLYTGYNGHKIRINALFFDWQEVEDISTGRTYRGFKYMVWGNVKDLTKAELLDAMYQWIENGTSLPWYIDYKFAQTDAERFKTPLSLK